MKVLICAMAYPPEILGGGEISTRLLAEGLLRCGIHVSVLTFTDHDFVCDEINGVRVNRIPCPNIYWAAAFATTVRCSKVQMAPLTSISTKAAPEHPRSCLDSRSPDRPYQHNRGLRRGILAVGQTGRLRHRSHATQQLSATSQRKYVRFPP